MKMLNLKQSIQKISKEQKEKIAASIWFGDPSHPERSPNEIYKTTNKKLDDITKSLKTKETTKEQIQDLTDYLNKHFFTSQNAKKYNSEEEYKTIQERLTNLQTNVSNKIFDKKNTELILFLKKYFKQCEDDQFNKLLKMFGLNKL